MDQATTIWWHSPATWRPPPGEGGQRADQRLPRLAPARRSRRPSPRSPGRAVSAPSLAVRGKHQGAYAHFHWTRLHDERGLARPARRAKKVYFTLRGQAWSPRSTSSSTRARAQRDVRVRLLRGLGRGRRVLFRNDLRRTTPSVPHLCPANGPASMIPFDGPHGTRSRRTPPERRTPTGPPTSRRSLVTLQNCLPYSRDDFWLPANATQTTGNNVDAYVDIAAPDGFQPDGRPARRDHRHPGMFDYAYDIDAVARRRQPPSARRRSSTSSTSTTGCTTGSTTPASTSAPATPRPQLRPRRSRGRQHPAEAQDYGGRNNANMTTPADGARAPHADVRVRRRLRAADVASSAASIARPYQAAGAAYRRDGVRRHRRPRLRRPTTIRPSTDRRLGRRPGCTDPLHGPAVAGQDRAHRARRRARSR